MFDLFRSLDELLRGRRFSPPGAADLARVEVPLRVFVPLAIGMGATSGFFMGWYKISMLWGAGVSDGYQQTIASMIKVPALFLLTLGVTFPSLYVFSALLGGRLSFVPLLRLLVGSMVVSLTVAASFGPILAFFTLSTTSYPFMVVLNVIFMAISGLVGVGFLIKALRRIANPPAEPGVVAPPPSEEGNLIIAVWTVIYGAVGVQMAWLLRPFIGNPAAPFEWFRERQGNFIIGLFENLQNLGK